MAEHTAVVFLLAAHQQAEELARAATAAPWTVDHSVYPKSISNADGVDVVAGGRWGGEASVFESAEDALHIVLHDPAAVLRRVAAERQILAEHGGAPGVCRVCAGPEWSSDDADGNREWSRSSEYWPCRTVLLLAEAWGWAEGVL